MPPKTKWTSIGAIWNKRTGAGKYLALDPEVIPDVLQHAEPMRNGKIAVQIFERDYDADVDKYGQEKADRMPFADCCVPQVDDVADKSEPAHPDNQVDDDDDIPWG